MYLAGSGSFTATIAGERKRITVALKGAAAGSPPLGHLTVSDCFEIVGALFSGAVPTDTVEARLGAEVYTITIANA